MGTGGKNNNGGNEGFIPHSYCAQFGSQLAELALNVKKKLPRAQTDSQTGMCNPTDAGESGQPTDPAGISVPRGSSVGPPAPNAAAELPLNSRSNSIMSSETSSQPDSHPFFKVSQSLFVILSNSNIYNRPNRNVYKKSEENPNTRRNNGNSLRSPRRVFGPAQNCNGSLRPGSS